MRVSLSGAEMACKVRYKLPVSKNVLEPKKDDQMLLHRSALKLRPMSKKYKEDCRLKAHDQPFYPARDEFPGKEDIRNRAGQGPPSPLVVTGFSSSCISSRHTLLRSRSEDP